MKFSLISGGFMKILTVIFTLFVSIAIAEEAGCAKCKLARDYHDKNPSKYEYYDDYLKDKAKGIAEDIRYTGENKETDTKK